MDGGRKHGRGSGAMKRNEREKCEAAPAVSPRTCPALPTWRERPPHSPSYLWCDSCRQFGTLWRFRTIRWTRERDWMAMEGGRGDWRWLAVRQRAVASVLCAGSSRQLAKIVSLLEEPELTTRLPRKRRQKRQYGPIYLQLTQSTTSKVANRP